VYLCLSLYVSCCVFLFLYALVESAVQNLDDDGGTSCHLRGNSPSICRPRLRVLYN
jgi:hypothetical protein